MWLHENNTPSGQNDRSRVLKWDILSLCKSNVVLEIKLNMKSIHVMTFTISLDKFFHFGMFSTGPFYFYGYKIAVSNYICKQTLVSKVDDLTIAMN